MTSTLHDNQYIFFYHTSFSSSWNKILKRKSKHILYSVTSIRKSCRSWHKCNVKKYSTARQVKVVKCTLVQALRLIRSRTAHRGSRGIPPPFHDHGTRRRWGVNVTSRPLFTPGKNPVPIVQEAGWAPGPDWTGAENLARKRDSIPRPSSSKPVAIMTTLPGPHSQTGHRWKYGAIALHAG